MLQGTQSRRKTSKRRGREAVSPVRNASVDPLTLPRLDRAIRKEYTTDPWSHRWATIALLWLDAGVLTEQDTGTARELVTTALLRWVNTQIEGTTVLRHFNLLAHTFPTEYGDTPGDLSHDSLDGTSWMFGIYGGVEFPWFTLEEKLTALEAACPGLGKTAWAIYSRAICGVLPFLTPAEARGMAERVWWGWNSTDEDFKEYVESECGGEDELAVPKPSEFDAHYPDWILCPQSELSEDELKTIALDGATDDLKEVANRLLALMDVSSKEFRMPTTFGESPVESESIYYLAYFRWNELDPAMRVIDDVDYDINACSGEGYTELLGGDAVPLDPAEFLKWKSATENGFAVLKHLDGLIPLIGTPVNN